MSEKATVGGFQWTDVLIPDFAGKGTTKTYFQYRSLAVYAVFYLGGLYVNQKSRSPALRAAALGLLFPGAGLTAVATIPSLLTFVVAVALIPVCLFAWFGCGGIFFPLFLWTGTTALAGAMARESVFDGAAYFWAVACIAGIIYVTLRTKAAHVAAETKRAGRNAYLLQAVQANQEKAMVAAVPGSRELDLKTLRFVQWWIELSLKPFGDWTYHDRIDQFQTAALRYQLYEAIYCLGLYQCHYTPNFHGYLNEAQKHVIHKSCTKDVMNFWKWESLLGKFNAHDWDPIKKDNIMVTGYVLQAIGIYENNTGDKHFSEKDSLEFVVTENARYKTDFQGLNDAVYSNMTADSYCLYPCEPNWIYTPCNLVGIGGIVAADRALKTTHGDSLKAAFLHALEAEFTEPDGSILPIRSQLTGFTIPGLCGVLTDCVNSLLCAAYLPAIAHRNWAISRQESVRYDEKGRLTIVGLQGADKLDPGNYKAGEGCLRGVFGAAAAEYGDVKIRDECLKQLDEEYFPVYATPTGSLKNKGLSTAAQGTALRARLIQYQDWTNMMNQGPAETAFTGPILSGANFEEVLVAKAFSHTGKDLDLVLYNNADAGVFELGVSRLQPGQKYAYEGGNLVAGSDGTASFKARVEGRTQIVIEPVA